jgi:hypothetical protein
MRKEEARENMKKKSKLKCFEYTKAAVLVFSLLFGR